MGHIRKELVSIKPIWRYGTLFPAWGVHWVDEQTTTEVKDTMYEPQIFSVDDIETEEVEPTTTAKPETEPESPEEVIEVEGKDKSTKVSTEESELSALRKELQALQQELLKVSATKRDPVKETKPQTEEKLTRGQIAQILKEHKDDPEVLLNVIEYLSEQKASEIKDKTMKDVNYQQWHSNLAGVANKIIADDEDGYLAANPKVQSSLGEYSENLGLKDHPIGKLAAYAIMRLSESVKAKPKVGEKKSTEEVKPNPNKGRMDKTRSLSTVDKSHGLTAEQLSTARKFGVKAETYAKFVRRS